MGYYNPMKEMMMKAFEDMCRMKRGGGKYPEDNRDQPRQSNFPDGNKVSFVPLLRNIGLIEGPHQCIVVLYLSSRQCLEHLQCMVPALPR